MNKRFEKISESVFNGSTAVVPLAYVQHVEYHWYPSDKERNKHNWRGIMIITKLTTYDYVNDVWANNVYMSADEGKEFLSAWCRYLHELENPELLTQSIND